MGVLRNTGRTTQFNGPQTVLDKGQITGYAGSQAATQPPDVSLRTFEPTSWNGKNYASQPAAQQNGLAGMANLNAIFQSLLPMVMNGGLLAPQQNQGQRALNAVNSAGAFNQAPQHNQQMSSMQDATARLGNLSRFGQPSNTMPGNMPQPLPVNYAGQSTGQAVNSMPTFNGPKIANETSAFNPPKQPATSTAKPVVPGSATSAAPSYGSLNSRNGIVNAWQNATNNGKNGSQAGSMLTSMLLGTMTPNEKQKFYSTGQVQQPSTNPFAKRPLII